MERTSVVSDLRSSRGYREVSLAISIALLLISFNASADYLVTGEVKGNVCRGFGIEVCGTRAIHAVKGEDGKLYTIAESFKSVTEYDEHKGRCWIRTKVANSGLLSWAANTAFQPEFYERNNHGELEKLDVEYVTFKCKKR